MPNSDSNKDDNLRQMRSKYTQSSPHDKIDDWANNVYLLLMQRVLTLVGAPLIVYFVMGISGSFEKMSNDITQLRLDVAKIQVLVENNQDDIDDLKNNGR